MVKSDLRFLAHRGSLVTLNPKLLRQAKTEELVILRNAIDSFRKLLELWRLSLQEVVDISTTDDWSTLQMDSDLIPEMLETLNGQIARRNMKRLREQKENEN